MPEYWQDGSCMRVRTAGSEVRTVKSKGRYSTQCSPEQTWLILDLLHNYL